MNKLTESRMRHLDAATAVFSAVISAERRNLTRAERVEEEQTKCLI